MKNVYIYSLSDPITNEVKYIGKSVNPKRRYNGHVQDVRKGYKTKKTNWLRKLIDSNKKPILKIIEVCDEYNWEEREIYWIDRINPHCNQRRGGGGTGKNNSDYISKISLKVLQYDLKFKLLNEFKSINEAGRLTGISIPNISNACNGKLKHTGFFIWRFKSKSVKIEKYDIKTEKDINISKVLRVDKIVEQISIETGEIISEYKSIKEAYTSNNFNRRAISNCCFKNLENTYYSRSCGYIWKFKDPVYYVS